MSYFAFVPKGKTLEEGYNPLQDNRTNWLGLNAFDEMVCKHFGVEPDKTYYYKDWKDQLYYSQSWSTKGILGIYGKYHIFTSPEQYRKLCALHSGSTSDKNGIDTILQKIQDFYDYAETIKNILDVLYNADYVLVGVFDED